jgi:hypothetical protein
MVISADFEKLQQYFDKKILLYQNIAILLYLFIAILLVKIVRLTKALKYHEYFCQIHFLGLAQDLLLLSRSSIGNLFIVTLDRYIEGRGGGSDHSYLH